MNNKECIEVLTEELKSINPNDLGREYEFKLAKSLEIAIKALEERPQGEWVLDCYSTFEKDWYKCSICGRVIHINKKQLKDYPFCHCGAEMKGGEK